jgi:hypothetical protein
VSSLAITPSTVYAAGDFEEIDGAEPRRYLAGIDTATGDLEG